MIRLFALLSFLTVVAVSVVALEPPAVAEGGFTMPTPYVENKNHGDKWCLSEFNFDVKTGWLRTQYQTFSGATCPAIGDAANVGWTGKHFRAEVSASGTDLWYSDGTTEHAATPVISATAIKTIVDYTKLITFASTRAR